LYVQCLSNCVPVVQTYRGADKSLVRPRRNKLQRQKILSFMYPISNHIWRNISTLSLSLSLSLYIYIYIYNKTSIKRNILTIKKNTHQEVGRAKDLPAPLLYILLHVYTRCCDIIYVRDIDNSGAIFWIRKTAPELSVSLV
jgi:hypothetical protein